MLGGKSDDRLQGFDQGLQAYSALARTRCERTWGLSPQALATVTAATGVALSASVGADVVYDLNVNASFGAGFGDYVLKISEPGVDRIATFEQYFSGSAFLVSRPILANGFQVLGYSGTLGAYASKLNASAIVSSGATNWYMNGLFFEDIGFDSNGQWDTDNESGYIGFRFLIQGNYHYGWAEVERLSSSSGKVLSWAYEDTAYAALKAGSTEPLNPVPEPSGLALLASGAAGIVALRRRRRSQQNR